jgi:8-oxo-dGTP pyrophosphatase MutT (NUDIX family)
MTQKFKIGVFAIIFDEKKRILFCHRTDYDLWNLPGGALEKGESPWQGVIREVKEETGLDVKIDRLSGIYFTAKLNQIAFSFICRIIGGKLTINDESDKFQCFSFNRIPRNVPQRHIKRIRDAIYKPNEIIMRTQRGPTVKELVARGVIKKARGDDDR